MKLFKTILEILIYLNRHQSFWPHSETWVYLTYKKVITSLVPHRILGFAVLLDMFLSEVYFELHWKNNLFISVFKLFFINLRDRYTFIIKDELVKQFCFKG